MFKMTTRKPMNLSPACNHTKTKALFYHCKFQQTKYKQTAQFIAWHFFMYLIKGHTTELTLQ